jgi:D-3-phosphoglycerate dehydrogenase
LDVFEYEPLSKDSKLLQFPNVVTTPHIGASTKEAFEKASEEAFKKIRQFIAASPLEDELPPRDRWYHESS